MIFMRAKEVNNSSVKTKNAIRAAFAELVKEKKELNKITVTEVVRRADINRSTFYLHYSDIYDIPAEIENEIMTEIMSITPHNREELFQYLNDLLDVLEANESMYRQILTSDSPSYVLKKFRREIAAKIQNIPDINHDPEEWFNMKVQMFVDGVFEQVVYCFRGITDYSFDELRRGITACMEEVF